MRHALVIYESMYGNTEAIAHAIGRGLGEWGSVDVVEIGAAPISLPADVALIVVGGPTHAFGMSRPSTRADAAKRAERGVISVDIGVREWLERVSLGAARPVVAAFDTHVEHPKLLRHIGSAASAIERRLTGLGLHVVAPVEHFWVHGSMGPLVDGESDRAEQWGCELARRLELIAAASPVA
jgi:Flavodoxin